MRGWSAKLFATLFAGVLVLVVGLFFHPSHTLILSPFATTTSSMPQQRGKATINKNVPFVFSFNVDGVLEEASTPAESSSPYWWLDSGARLIIEKNIGQTIQGALAQNDPWRVEYSQENPGDTAGGAHPQNLFRLVSLEKWDNVSEQAFFKIVKDNLDDSVNRNESNGILLFSRYADSQSLYYAGLRVDGTAVIKKKYKGEYYTMTQQQLLPGTYDRTTTPDLLPHDQWIGLRTDTKTLVDGSIDVKLFILFPNSKSWRLALEAKDAYQYDNTPPIPTGNIGIRTDFMDVQFSNFRAEAI